MNSRWMRPASACPAAAKTAPAAKAAPEADATPTGGVHFSADNSKLVVGDGGGVHLDLTPKPAGAQDTLDPGSYEQAPGRPHHAEIPVLGEQLLAVGRFILDGLSGIALRHPVPEPGRVYQFSVLIKIT